jgi:hypothetical protein
MIYGTNMPRKDGKVMKAGQSNGFSLAKSEQKPVEVALAHREPEWIMLENIRRKSGKQTIVNGYKLCILTFSSFALMIVNIIDIETHFWTLNCGLRMVRIYYANTQALKRGIRITYNVIQGIQGIQDHSL